MTQPLPPLKAPVPPQLTLVVNFWPNPPRSEDATEVERRVAARQPILKLDVVQATYGPDRINLITDRCRNKVADLSWGTAEVWEVVKALTAVDHLETIWCWSDAGWVCCDSYCLRRYDDGNEHGWLVDVYLKFGVSYTGKMLLMVSCHLST